MSRLKEWLERDNKQGLCQGQVERETRSGELELSAFDNHRICSPVHAWSWTVCLCMYVCVSAGRPNQVASARVKTVRA